MNFLKSVFSKIKNIFSKKIVIKIENIKTFMSDASWQQNTQTGVIAVYDSDNKTYIIKEVKTKNNEEAEKLAIELAIEQIKHLDTKDFCIIKNDNQNAITHFMEKYKNTPNIEFMWIPRKLNTIADSLTRIKIPNAKEMEPKKVIAENSAPKETENSSKTKQIVENLDITEQITENSKENSHIAQLFDNYQKVVEKFKNSVIKASERTLIQNAQNSIAKYKNSFNKKEKIFIKNLISKL